MVVFKLSTSAVYRRFLYFGELRHFFRANLTVTAANFRLTEPVGRLTCLQVRARRSSDHVASVVRSQNDDERGYITAMTDLQRSGRALAALRRLLLLLL